MRKTILKGMYKEKQQGNEYKVPVKLTERNKKVHLDRKLTIPFFAFHMCFRQWLLFEKFLVSSQTQIFLSDGHESSNSHLQINYVLYASYISCYVQHYFWNCILAYNLTIMVHQGEESAPWSATAIFLLTSQS